MIRSTFPYKLSFAVALALSLAACGAGTEDDSDTSPSLSGTGGTQSPTSSGGSGGSSSLQGTVWVRLPGPSGDRTEIAIGGIKNEPANRVYMCEKKGSTAAGFYKGTLTNNVVKWDAQYGLPDADFTLSGNRLVVQYQVSYSLATSYDKGTWSGECGPLEYVPPTRLAVVLPAGSSVVTGVTVDGKSVPLSYLSPGAPVPDCSNASTTFTLPAPSNQNSTGKYYSVKVTSRQAGADTIVRTTTHETTFYEWYFKKGACNPYTVEWGNLGYTLAPLSR